MRRERRWKLAALLAVGIAIGVVIMGTPAGAHIGSVTHLWKKHIKPRTDARYYKKGQADARFGRVAVSQNAGVSVPATFGDITSASLTAPRKGFVLVNGTARLDGASGCPCEARMRLFDGTNASFIYRLHVESTGSDTAAISFRFPASKGTHNYAVQTEQAFGTFTSASDDATITALFVPYNGTGGTASTRPLLRSQAGG
jgi:hypothetical protein